MILQVNKHSSFQESRCFYVVSTDGRKEDFSYRKCLENLIKSKFSDIADDFNGKYFRKPRSVGNWERFSTPERQSTPDGGNHERFSTPEQFSTPEFHSIQEQAENEKAQ